jgi:ElaA protein
VPASARGTGLGRELVQRGIDFNRAQWPGAGIAIGAQAYLRGFYAGLGFVAAGEPYLEDGIFHIHMQLKAG